MHTQLAYHASLVHIDELQRDAAKHRRTTHGPGFRAALRSGKMARSSALTRLVRTRRGLSRQTGPRPSLTVDEHAAPRNA
jgi:hypothetical protein